MNAFRKYYLLSVIGTLLASFYPIYMGAKVIINMAQDGTVKAENYPKYIIPYTPISIAIIIGVILMPVFIRLTKRFAILVSSVISVGVFFLTETLLENIVIVTETVETTLESWQMYMCYISPDKFQTRTWRAVDVLIGDYSPAFKIHFYIISIVLILSILSCIYGFAKVIKSGNKNKLKALIMQSVSSIVFLSLCIFACFTAFYRDGEITVSPVSAVLMTVFFIVFGVVMGIYTGSFLLGKRKLFSVLLPATVSAIFSFLMYIGEMILLNGSLYRFGTGFLFEGIGNLVFAPVDLFTIAASGFICALFMIILTKKK